MSKYLFRLDRFVSRWNPETSIKKGHALPEEIKSNTPENQKIWDNIPLFSEIANPLIMRLRGNYKKGGK